MDSTSRMIYEKAQDSAEHYNTMMWTIFYVGIGFSLYALYFFWHKGIFVDYESLNIVPLVLGYAMLVYSSIVIESFAQKRLLAYSLQNSLIDLDWPESITALNHIKLKWIGELFLSLIFICYIISFYLFALENVVIGFVLLSLALIFFSIVIANWLSRPLDIIKCKIYKNTSAVNTK